MINQYFTLYSFLQIDFTPRKTKKKNKCRAKTKLPVVGLSQSHERNTISNGRGKPFTLTNHQSALKRPLHDVSETNAGNEQEDKLIRNIAEKCARRRAIDNAPNHSLDMKMNIHTDSASLNRKIFPHVMTDGNNDQNVSRDKLTKMAAHDSRDDAHEKMIIQEVIPRKNRVSEETVFNDSVRGDVGKKKEEVRAPNTNSENKISLGGATTCTDVKEKLREWMQKFECTYIDFCNLSF